MSPTVTLWQRLSAITLSAPPGASARGRPRSATSPRLSSRPQMRPGPKIATSWMPSPQIRLLCQ